MDKELPSYSVATAKPPPANSLPLNAKLRGRRRLRRSRAIKFFVVACLALIALAQWKQLNHSRNATPSLSLEKLDKDLQTCKKLHAKPSDPIGLGRDKNARYIDGGKPTLIQNATIWVGEPVEGTSEADARKGKGWEWISADVLLENGLIKKVGKSISKESVLADTLVYDAAGRQLTAGIIDMHSHVMVYSLPSLNGNDDGNEMSDDITVMLPVSSGFQKLTDPDVSPGHAPSMP
jgi:hypothetical protein